MLAISDISKIGIGSRGIGGLTTRDDTLDISKQIEGLVYSFQQGCNFIEVNMRYSEGFSVDIISEALSKSGIPREKIFICVAIYLKNNKTLEDAEIELRKVMKLFKTDYIDTVQFTMGGFLSNGFENIVTWMDKRFQERIIRYTSLTNGNLELVKRFYDYFGKRFFSHEVVFNFEVRVNEDLGIIDYGINNNIKTVVYQPLRRNRTALLKRSVIESLSNKYSKTPNQIILNWIINKGYLPLIKSENILHIKENLNAVDFVMDKDDHLLIDNYQIPYTEPSIDRYKKGIGYGIDQLSNIFDEEFSKQNNNSNNIN